jgi:hypothetical protein
MGLYGPTTSFMFHFQYSSFPVTIVEGIPRRFEFYRGYDKKYSSFFAQWRDILDKRRRESVRRLREK